MLTPLCEDDIEMILRWRNQANVREVSFSDRVITADEHREWWKCVRDDRTRRWMIYRDSDKPVGVVGFHDIEPGEQACWSFYLSDELNDNEKLKYWLMIERSAITYAFESLGLRKLRCEVLSFNKAAVLLHKQEGFVPVDCYEHERGEVIVFELDNERK